jgi:hypothetical protein
MNHLPVVVIASLFLMVGSDCGEREKPKKRGEGLDGGIVMRPECNEPGNNCLKSCAERNASPACDRCCMDQDYVCNSGHKADFESCKGSR